MNYPLRHISIRVPWHDTGWDGRVCAAPRLNGSCLKLKRIAESRDDAAEEAVAGKRLDELSQAQWPACARWPAPTGESRAAGGASLSFAGKMMACWPSRWSSASWSRSGPVRRWW